MKYEKPALSFDELADKLFGRGLIADRNELVARLKVTSYFRLSAYLYPFRDHGDALKPGTTLTAVQRFYDFDQRLRTVVLDAIESIEVHVRTQLAHHARLWNWSIGYPVLIPSYRKNPDWHVDRIPNDRMGIILTICCYWLKRIRLKSDWATGIIDLFDEYPEISYTDVGMPNNWQRHPIWINTCTAK